MRVDHERGSEAGRDRLQAPDREGRRRADARRRAAQGRRVPAGRRRKISGDPQSRAVPEGQALGSAADAGGEGQPLHELGDRQSGMVGAAAATPPCGSTAAAAASRPASASRGRSPRRSISTTRSNGRRRSRGATARSGCRAFPTTPSTSGSSPTCSRRRSKAIMPWEGFADIYRDALYHGGILSVFMTNWFTAHLMHHTAGPRLAASAGRLADQHAVALAAQQSRQRRAARRAGAVGQDHGADVHGRQLDRLRRCICAATPRRSCAPPRKHKKLRIHTGSHVHPFYTEEGRRDQLRFFDYWLKGIDNGVMDEPPVKLAIRKGRDEIEWRHEHEWPLKRTQWTKFYFDLSEGGRRQGAARRRAGDGEARPSVSACTYPSSSLGSMGSTSAASSQVMGGGIKPDMGISLETPPLDRGHRDHRAARRERSGCRARARTWTCS